MSRPIDAIELAGEWGVWSFLFVRSAGFSTRWLEALRAPRAARVIDELLAIDEIADDRRAEAREALEQITLEPGCAKSLRSDAGAALSALARGRAPAPRQARVVAVLEPLAAIERRRLEIEAELAKVLSAEQLAVSEALVDICRSPEFREAVTWQNRRVLATAIDKLVRQRPEAGGRQVRRKRQLVARYVQRYAAKNETIGFFGPFAWGRVGEQTRVRHGERLLRERRLYFEAWGIDALAGVLAEAPAIKAALAPRLHPTLRLEGDQLVGATGEARGLSANLAALLGRCDGTTSAAEIAGAEVAAGRARDPDELLELLAELEGRQLVIWSFDLPPTEPHPERWLRQRLVAAGAGVDKLDRLEEAGRQVAGAAGDPDALAVALGGLDRCFSEITGHSATRRPGQSYSGRTLVYEDCRRDVDVELSASLLARIAEPLELIAISARWYTFEIARRFGEIARELFEELGGARMPFARLYERLVPHIPDERSRERDLVDDVVDELRARWSEILALDSETARAERAVADLAAAVKARFAAPYPGWPAARHHSPDVMIASPGLEALQSGEALFVLGELHTGLNQMTTRLLLRECPDADGVIERSVAEVPGPRVEPVIPGERCSRVSQGTIVVPQLEIELGSTRSSRPPEQILRVADLQVERQGDRLVVSGPNCGRALDLIEVVEHQLLVGSMGRFRPVANRGHRPRVSLGELVIAREQWLLEPDAIDFVSAPRGPAQLVAARRWARRIGLPRLSFVKVPEEGKPVLLDLDCPLIVDDVARLIAAATTVTFTEMLPDLDQLWMPHPDGGRCTSEIRMILVDPRQWPGSGITGDATGRSRSTG